VKAAVLTAFGAPEFGEFQTPPDQMAGGVTVDVLAVALSHLDQLKASGTFYTGPPELPSVAGNDGIGRLSDGQRVYFDKTQTPFGSLAEKSVVDPTAVMPVPDGVDDVMAACLGNAGLASLLSLEWRARLVPGETVLVLGATGFVGKLAVQVAQLLGAGRVVAVGRNSAALDQCRELGADEVVQISAGIDLASQLRAATKGGHDIAIDLLWGRPGLAALTAAAPCARHIQLGHLAEVSIELPAPLLRAAPLQLLGHANFHVPLADRVAAYGRICSWAATGRLVVEAEVFPLDRISEAWRQLARGARRKPVLVPGEA
jgi:NADPH:quinone reductase-like Zn-dependent oxidoreductase